VRASRSDIVVGAEIPGQVPFDSPAGRWTLFATVLGSGLAYLDATLVSVALPAIGREFDSGVSICSLSSRRIRSP